MTERNEEDWEISELGETATVEPDKISTNIFESDMLVGQLLDDRFLIEKNLTDSGADAGGIGLVYLAKDMKLMGKRVVVKILQKAALQSDDMIRKFQHEKEALIRLEHPNIVRILDSGTLSDGNPFMVMEFIEGFSLRRKMLDEGQLSFEQAAYFVEKVTDALGAAHSKQILHRDIKPENIMLSPKEDGFDHVRLIDFGIARVENSQLAAATEIPRGIGTIRYIAPEQLFGKLEQTPAVDIYSFSIVVYEMLTGKLPFNPESPVEMFQLQKEGVSIPPRELRKEISISAEKILLSGLEFEEQRRPQNARKLGKELAAALRESSGRNRPGNIVIPVVAETVRSDLISKPVEPAAFSNPSADFEDALQQFNTTSQPKPSSHKAWIWGLLALLILAAISIPVGFAIWKSSEAVSTAKSSNATTEKKSDPENRNTPAVDGGAENVDAPPAESEEQRELAYFLNVQKMRDGKPFEEPFKSSGQEVFESGYKFKMNFEVDAAGFIYIFNEDKDDAGNSFYNILYPTPRANRGLADVKSKEKIETSYNTFSGARGTEIVWMIWTEKRQDDLEEARQAAFDGNGTLRDVKIVQNLTDFIQKYKDTKLEVNKDSANQKTVVKGKGDAFAYRIELEHR